MAMIAQEILSVLRESTIAESSGYSLRGSITTDLVKSKVWLLEELSKISKHYAVAYILGSWYSNTALFIHLTGLISVDHVINVDTNKTFLQTGASLLDFAGVKFKVDHMSKDANKLNYQQLTKNSVVINTSLQNIHDDQWFQNIPSGTLVAMQARDNDPDVQYRSLEDIDRRFPLSQTLYQGTLKLQDPETRYQRFMKIGVK
jgi:hypothetical protein